MRVTLAPGAAAPLASVTVPWMLPVPVCDHPTDARINRQPPTSRNQAGLEPMLCIRPPRPICGDLVIAGYCTSGRNCCQGGVGADESRVRLCSKQLPAHESCCTLMLAVEFA